MVVNVEKLEKLERKIVLTLPAETIASEVQVRLKRLARTVKMDGFRPGKVPMNVVAQRYGYSVHYEVMNDKVGQAFSAAANEAKLRVAGQPRISEKEAAPDGQLLFDAIFEVYPEVVIADLSGVEVEKVTAQVTQEAVDKTLEVLRKQRRTFAQRALDAAVQEGDRVTVDFEGKIDGDTFAGGKAENYQFLAGEGQMLKEFEAAVLGMKVGESKTFALNFPADYHGADVAGKQADFIVTVKKIEAAHLPDFNADLVKSLGVADGTLESLRANISKNLEREVQSRLLARNKNAVMQVLLDNAELDLPQATVQAEVARMVEAARADLKQRGVKNPETIPVPDDLFRPQSEKRVRLGLVVAELVRREQLQVQPAQLQAYLEEMAASYEKPQEVIRWYLGDRQRVAELEAVVMENNVTGFVHSKAKIKEKEIPFDELMTQADAA